MPHVSTLASGPYAPPLQRSETLHRTTEPGHSHFKSADVQSEDHQCPVPAEMDPDRQPEIAGPNVGVPEHEPESERIDQPEHGYALIPGVTQARTEQLVGSRAENGPDPATSV